MKIAELITESQSTDEGVLGSIASGAGTALGAVGKGLGAISGAFKGAKDQYQKGQALGRATVGGHMPAQPKDTSVRDQEFARLTGKGGAPAPAGGGQDLAAQIKAKEAELADLKAQQKAAGAQQAPAAQEPTPLAPPPKTEPGIGQAVNSNNAASTNTAPSPAKEPAANSLAPTDPVGNAVPGNDKVVPDAATQARIDAAPQGYDGETGKPVAAPATQTAPAGQAPVAPSKVDKKAMKNQYKADVGAAQTAAAKPGFQQTATDKLAQKKVNVGDGPKINAYGKQYEGVEFYSNFLGRML
jgi:hypothetical protein